MKHYRWIILAVLFAMLGLLLCVAAPRKTERKIARHKM